ncbi:hypothetical protein TNCV_371641 [Trichonephila clavipes]|nr:hypothetical protein TNCV_371641 [Trichonephila clavipes]
MFILKGDPLKSWSWRKPNLGCHKCLKNDKTSVLVMHVLTVGSLVVRASDSRLEGLGSMPPNTLRVHMKYILDKSVGSSVLWAVATETPGAEKYFLPLYLMPKLWRWR